MAKKQGGKLDPKSLLTKIKEFSPFAETFDNSEAVKIKEWIHTGSYIFNAVLSGSLLKGVPNNRSISIAGESGSGKTFLCMNLAKNMQKQDYTIYYLDTEGAIGYEMKKTFAIDGSNFYHIPISDLQVLKSVVTNIITTVKTAKLAGDEVPKIALFLDSLGMLASTKEIEDAKNGSDKRDMTKAQMVRSFFRIVTSDLTSLGIPLIMTNHIVTDIANPYAQFAQSGGLGVVYATSIIVSLSKAKLKDDKADAAAQTGVVVTSKAEKNRFTKPEKVKFQIHFKKGMNPYVGLLEFVSWDACGIGRGNILTQKDYNKLSDSDKANCGEFTNTDGEIVYFYPKDSARNYVCKHLGRAVSPAEFYTAQVFTQEVLEQLDENVIIPKFSLGSGYDDDSFDEFMDDVNEDVEQADL